MSRGSITATHGYRCVLVPCTCHIYERYPMRVKICGWLLFGAIFIVPGAPSLAEGTMRAQVNQDPDSLVRSLYAAVTFDPGKVPDWSFVRSLFHKDASIVLRVTRDSTAVMSVDGF